MNRTVLLASAGIVLGLLLAVGGTLLLGRARALTRHGGPDGQRMHNDVAQYAAAVAALIGFLTLAAGGAALTAEIAPLDDPLRLVVAALVGVVLFVVAGISFSRLADRAEERRTRSLPPPVLAAARPRAAIRTGDPARPTSGVPDLRASGPTSGRADRQPPVIAPVSAQPYTHATAGRGGEVVSRHRIIDPADEPRTTDEPVRAPASASADEPRAMSGPAPGDERLVSASDVRRGVVQPSGEHPIWTGPDDDGQPAADQPPEPAKDEPTANEPARDEPTANEPARDEPARSELAPPAGPDANAEVSGSGDERGADTDENPQPDRRSWPRPVDGQPAAESDLARAAVPPPVPAPAVVTPEPVAPPPPPAAQEPDPTERPPAEQAADTAPPTATEPDGPTTDATEPAAAEPATERAEDTPSDERTPVVIEDAASLADGVLPGWIYQDEAGAWFLGIDARPDAPVLLELPGFVATDADRPAYPLRPEGAGEITVMPNEDDPTN